MRMIRGFYNEQNNTVNVIHYDTNCIISDTIIKWQRVCLYNGYGRNGKRT